MTTEGIESVMIETHNWGRSVRFFKALGYEVDFETDHNSGLLRNGSGPYLFVAEVPASQPTEARVVLRAEDADTFQLDAEVEMVSAFEATHWGTRVMVVRDPDGRLWNIEAPAGE
jgi:catechol 2,3-dioxygenase-like lactoylglutathione lyase family enzyme